MSKKPIKHTVDHVERHLELVKQIKHHDHLYYNLHTPTLLDPEYDQLFKDLKTLETEHPELITLDSPTQRVAGNVAKNQPKVKHLTPMLSLYTETDFTSEGAHAFVRRVKERLTGDAEYARPTGLSYCCELKFDGLALTLLYRDGKLISAGTRGDGEYGEDVTANAMAMDCIPTVLRSSGNKDVLLNSILEVRGEVMMPKSRFQLINAALQAQGKKLYVNERAAAAGSLRLKDTQAMKERGLVFYAYSASDPSGHLEQPSQHQWLAKLKKWGFPVHELVATRDTPEGLIAFHEQVSKVRDKLDFHVDGVVYKVDSIAMQDRLGFTGREPRWATAHKFEPEEAMTRVEAIDIQVGRTGKLTPVARVTPVFVGGVTISNVTLHNEDHIRKLGVQVDDDVLVRRAGDVIPEIFDIMDRGGVAVVKGSCTSGYVFPTQCPSCGSPVQREEGKADQYCSNTMSCPAQLKQAILHMTGRKALNVIGLGEKLVDQLVDLGVIKSVVDVFCLGMRARVNNDPKAMVKEAQDHVRNLLPDTDTVDMEAALVLSEITGVGRLTATNLARAIEQAKTTTLTKFIYSLGIRNTGEGTAKRLVKHYHCLHAIEWASEAELTQIKDIGPIVAKSVHSFFKDPANQEVLSMLMLLGVRWPEETFVSPTEEQHFAGKTFVITGTAANTSRELLKELIEAGGGSVSSSVNAKTSYVIAGQNAGSKLAKASAFNVPVIMMDGAMGFLTQSASNPSADPPW